LLSFCFARANELFKYYSNTFTITSPNLQHDEKHDEYTSVLFIGFTYDNCPVVLKNGVYYDDSGLTILKLLEDMKNEFVNKGVNYEIKLDLLVKLMLIEFGRMCDNSSSKSDEFGYIKKYICENATQQIDFKALAKLSGYSYHHFRHLFKKKHRTFPIRLFNRQEN